VPGLIQDVQNQIDELQHQRDKLSIWNPGDWENIKAIWDKISDLEDYMDDLQDYKDSWDEYYKNCNCIY